jgi:hypothetical protein
MTILRIFALIYQHRAIAPTVAEPCRSGDKCMRTVWLILCCCCTLAFAGELQMRVIQPRHAAAEELAPLVRELLHGEETVSVYRNSLVINADKDTLVRIDRLLLSLDKPSRNLLIQLRRRGDVVQRTGGAEVSGSARIGNSRIGTRGASSGASIRTSRTVSTRGAQGAQSVRALEGKPVLISDGQLVPLAARTYWGEGVDYEDMQRGFTVTATIQGEQVRLDIDVRDDRLGDGSLRSGALRSSVSGRLGEWIFLGGGDDATVGDDREIASHYRTRFEEHSSYEIKIELVD